VTPPQRSEQRPPRLVVRTLVATFGGIAVLLSVTFLTLIVETRNRVTRDVAANLDASQLVFADMEGRRQKEELLQAALLAESPTLKAALDTYQAEVRRSDAGPSADLLATVQHELDRLATHVVADAIVVADQKGRILASAGDRRKAWIGGQLNAASEAAGETMIDRSGETFRVLTVPLESAGESMGRLLLATAVDPQFAGAVSAVSRAPTAIVLDGRVVASTLDPYPHKAIEAMARELPTRGEVSIGGDPQAVHLLFRFGDARVYAVDSIGAAAAVASRSAAEALMVIGLGSLGLGALVSVWLARNVARPIDQLAQQLRDLASAHDFSQRLPAPGTSLELNALTDTFNELMSSLVAAEQATEAAYLAAIKGLAAALDARDPYTAGHSERVSALSIMIARQMQLPDSDIEVVRLGALLHDIGKIGIRDKVLSKNGPLTPEEFEIIKTHPTVGAHILRQIPFLTAHVPIVELHHEQPDGRGYPQGLLGHATPLLARIVHVADAFDAMTSARAYRTAQGEEHALAELRCNGGTQFDADVVAAFMEAWATDETSDIAAIQASVRSVRSTFHREAGGLR
jgi:putative nucleotidyltransferase with HDIG domain